MVQIIALFPNKYLALLWPRAKVTQVDGALSSGLYFAANPPSFYLTFLNFDHLSILPAFIFDISTCCPALYLTFLYFVLLSILHFSIYLLQEEPGIEGAFESANRAILTQQRFELFELKFSIEKAT